MILSIIIPIYKVEKYISATLESLYSQGMDETLCEVIAVDDGTPDDSMSIVEKYSTEHTNLKIITQDNQGLSAARNAGLHIAKGEYVWFVDSDDTITECAIAEILNLINRYPKTDIFGFGINHVDENTGNSTYSHIIPASQHNKYNQLHHDAISLALVGPVQRYIFSRHFLIENELKFFPGILHEDMEFLPRAFFFARSIFISDIAIYNYLLRDSGSIMSTFRIRQYEDLNMIIDRIIDFKNSHATNHRQHLFLLQNAVIILAMIMHAKPPKYVSEQYKTIIKDNSSKYRQLALQSLLDSFMCHNKYTFLTSLWCTLSPWMCHNIYRRYPLWK